MSRPQTPGRGNGRGNGGTVARGAGFAAAKGAGLIGLAVVIGIVLLNVVDDGSTTDSNGNSGSTARDDDHHRGRGRIDDHAHLRQGAGEDARRALGARAERRRAAGRGPHHVREPQAAAATRTSCNRATGRATRRPATPCTARRASTGKRAALATAVGSGTPVKPFPTPAPPGSDGADCVVVVGKAA